MAGLLTQTSGVLDLTLTGVMRTQKSWDLVGVCFDGGTQQRIRKLVTFFSMSASKRWDYYIELNGR